MAGFVLTMAGVESLQQRLHCPQRIKYLLSIPLWEKFATTKLSRQYYTTSTSLHIPYPPLLEVP